jgi:hypothetical protein
VGRSAGAQAQGCTRQPGFPKNEIFWDGGTAQGEHRIGQGSRKGVAFVGCFDEPRIFL